MIKNIIFDLSEVIISGYIGAEVGPVMEKKYGIHTEEFRKRKREKEETFLTLMRGEIKEEKYCEELLEGMKWNITVDDLKITIRECLNHPVERTMEIVRALKENYYLILLSDHVREWMAYIEKENQDIDIFDKKIFSYEIGSLKGDEKTFRKILNETKIVANETLFIDDNLQNVKKATEVGINGIVFKNANQLKEELAKKYQIVIN